MSLLISLILVSLAIAPQPALSLLAPDEIDAAFSSILAHLDRSSEYDFRGSGFGVHLPRVRRLADKIERLVGYMYDAALDDEAGFLKQQLVDLGQQRGLSSEPAPFFDDLPYPNPGQDRLAQSSEQSLTKRLDDLDDIVSKYENQTDEFRKMTPTERKKAVDKNRKAQSQLNDRHTKLLKQCYYMRTRIEYLLNELFEDRKQRDKNKNLTERLSVWKRFIENNEYVLNQQLSRPERDLLYSFLAKKLKETEPDISQGEDIVFSFN